ncbi:MAG: hypothetical protein CSYNP_02046 [Syntrophus sp. SKADARSKE-3]|nr:hypothetical protein [Syntrophus sp. SKADARSKE-3]
MSWVKHFHKKFPILILSILLAWSAFVIAFDQHNDGFSPLCPICQAENSINGTQGTFVLDFYPTLSRYYTDVKLFGYSVQTSVPFEGRASPALPQV